MRIGDPHRTRALCIHPYNLCAKRPSTARGYEKRFFKRGIIHEYIYILFIHTFNIYLTHINRLKYARARRGVCEVAVGIAGRWLGANLEQATTTRETKSYKKL